jgi:hypothetical protein
MIHEIEAFDKQTERLVFSLAIPVEHHSSLKKIMEWETQEDEVYGYDLSEKQIRELEKLLGKPFYDPVYDFQLGAYA